MTKAFIWVMEISQLKFSLAALGDECEVGTTVVEIKF
jgi:hypothetical protein